MPNPYALDPVAERYLDLLKGCLTRELFPDATIPFPLRRRDRWIATARRVLRGGRPARARRTEAYDEERRSLGRDWPTEAETMIGRKRLDNIQDCIVRALRDGVPGDLIETGVWRGGSTIFMKAVLEALNDTTRVVWVADSFAGLPKPKEDEYPADKGDWTWTVAELAVSADEVRANFERYGLLDERVRFLEGWFRDTLPIAPIESLAILRLDGDLYESTMDALRSLHPKVSEGGFVIVDDYGSYPACAQAVDDYRREHGIDDELLPVGPDAVYWRRSSHVRAVSDDG